MIPILAAAALVLQMQAPSLAPNPACNIKTVSYKFTGAPGTEFRYRGAKYVVPASGEIELIADKKATQAEYAGARLQLDGYPADDFGARTVPLGISATAPTTTVATKGN